MSLASMLLAGIVAVAVLGILVWTSGILEGIGRGGGSETATADVLETRIATVGSYASSHGGYILYRIETHVRYSVDRVPRDRWIPASDTTSDRAILMMQLVDAPKTCLVYWSKGHEDNARCKLEMASK
jgi:hypothetical protein